MLLIELLEQIEKQYIRRNPYRPIICNSFNEKNYHYIEYMRYNEDKNQLECTISPINEINNQDKNILPSFINAENIRDEIMFFTKYTNQVQLEQLEKATVKYRLMNNEEFKDFSHVTCWNNHCNRHLAEIHLIF